ncbi:MAG TPA: DNA polymerase III subunit delta [Polyangiaceae bacterium]|nr:DNA polymerase III subunit delta [Polyangiaceae bacterium]
MTPEQALAEAAQGQLRPVYLVAGEEPYLASAVVSALKAAATQGGVKGLNDDQYQAGEADVDRVLADARTLPMMAKRRFVLVRGLERWEPKAGKSEGKVTDKDPLEKLLDYAKAPSPSTVLVLLGAGVDKRRKLYTVAKADGFLVACEPLGRAELPPWIEKRVAARGNQISQSVADLLAELTGPELAPVADAIERLCLYVGEGNEIVEDSVATCIVRLRTASVWELVGAVGRRDAGAAIAALADVYDPQDRGLRLLGVLAWSTRQLLRFDAALRGGASPDQAAIRAGAPPFKSRELSQQLKALPRADLERWPELLARLDLELKGGTRRPPLAVLEAAILKLCRTNTAAPRRRTA